MSMPSRTFVVVVTETVDQIVQALEKFSSYTGSWEQVLFVYHIGLEEISNQRFQYLVKANGPSDELNRICCLFNSPEDLVTKEPYGKDYKTAFADATVVGQQMAGVTADDIKYINFFEKPKHDPYADLEEDYQEQTPLI
jgi:hypothetical protein